MIVEIKLNEVLDISTKSKVEEVDELPKLVTTITLKAQLPPVALARLHNLIAAGQKIEVHFRCNQAIMDLTMLDTKGTVIPVEKEETYQAITTQEGQPKVTAQQFLDGIILANATDATIDISPGYAGKKKSG